MFRMRRDAQKWFEDLKLPLDFDGYYFCLVAGYCAVRPVSFERSAGVDVIRDFPGIYALRRHLLVAGLINAELADKGIRTDEVSSVKGLIAQLVSSTGLSDHGAARMNDYSSGGFEELRDRMDKPRALETFLRLYPTILANISGDRTGTVLIGGTTS